jgi:branched-chain amino acid transport system permease protein
VDSYIEFAVLGLSSSAIYIGLALGLITIYRCTGVINFAQGAMAMWAAYVYAALRADGRLILPIGHIDLGGPMGLAPALIIGLVMSLLLGLIVQGLIFRPLRSAPTLAKVVASVAVMLTVQALAKLRFGETTVQVAALLPAGNVTIGSLVLNKGDLILAASALVLCVLMALFFRRTTIGLATRASSMDEQAVSLMGFSPTLLSAVAWSLAGLISSVVVVFAAPSTGLNADSYTLYVVPALAILLIARFEKLWVIALAGIVLGAFQAVITLLSSKTYWPTWGQTGLQDAVPFVVIVITLFVMGRRLPARGSLDSASLPDVRLPSIKPVPLVAPLVVMVILLLVTTGSYRYGVITSIAMSLLALSYVIVTGYLGQISLAQISFAGAGGFVLSKATTSWHVPFPFSLLLSALVAGVFGVVVAVPAFRIRGAQLAIVTLAAGVAIQTFVFSNPSLTQVSGNPISSPTIFGANLEVQSGRDIARLSFGFMVLVVAVVFIGIFIVAARSSLGRAWLAVRSNERAAASAGVNVRSVKLIGFALSAFMAGGAGALIGYSRGQMSVDSFTITIGLLLMASTYLGGITSINGALIAGLLSPLGLVYVFLDNEINFGQYYNLTAGLALIVTTILNPDGIASKTYDQYRWIRSKLQRPPGAATPPSVETALSKPETANEPVGVTHGN